MRGALLRSYMDQVEGWKLKEKKITKEYVFKDDREALGFLHRIGRVAVKQGHHPVLNWVYNRVRVEFWTHAIGGLSENDFIMAAKFDRVYEKKKQSIS